jgi:branched-chain amino acid transport system substrate-binding protein
VRLLAAFLLIALLVASGASAAQAPYEIDVIMSLTGSGAFIGAANKTTLDVLEEVVNKSGGIRGQPIHFVYFDDGTNPQNAVQFANAILAKGLPVILGPNLTAQCRAVGALAEGKALNYCISPGIHPGAGSYVFSGSFSTGDEMPPLLRYFRQRGWQRVATLTSTDATGQDADDGLAAAFKLPENRSLALVIAEHFNPTDQSVTAQLARIKAQNPQVIIIWTAGTPFGTALLALQQSGMDDIPIATTGANTVHSQLAQYANLLPQNLYFAGPGFLAGVGGNAQSHQAIRTFLAAMKAHGVPIDNQSGIAWDPGMITIDALRALGTNASAKALRDWVEGLRNYGGIQGDYNFADGNHHGLTANNVLITRWNPTTSALDAVTGMGGAPVRGR